MVLGSRDPESVVTDDIQSHMLTLRPVAEEVVPLLIFLFQVEPGQGGEEALAWQPPTQQFHFALAGNPLVLLVLD